MAFILLWYRQTVKKINLGPLPMFIRMLHANRVRNEKKTKIILLKKKLTIFNTLLVRL
jgi:hypothetical protein